MTEVSHPFLELLFSLLWASVPFTFAGALLVLVATLLYGANETKKEGKPFSALLILWFAILALLAALAAFYISGCIALGIPYS